MDRLYEQMRVRYPDKKDKVPQNTEEGQMPQKKTVSFKEEKKVNWFQGHLAGQRKEADESSDGEFAAVIAAATYAISSLEQGSLSKKMPVDGLQASTMRTKSKKESSIHKLTDSGRISRWFSGKEAKEDGESAGSKRFGDEKGKIGGQNASAPVRTPTSRTGSGKVNLTNSGHGDTKADAWEKAELAKIQRRYGKMYSSILEWEQKKKTKAKLRLERKERELQLRRASALQEYNEEITRINKIATGAKEVTDQKKRKDESKIKEKANEIRSTGHIARSCLCF